MPMKLCSPQFYLSCKDTENDANGPNSNWLINFKTSNLKSHTFNLEINLDFHRLFLNAKCELLFIWPEKKTRTKQQQKHQQQNPSQPRNCGFPCLASSLGDSGCRPDLLGTMKPEKLLSIFCSCFHKATEQRWPWGGVRWDLADWSSGLSLQWEWLEFHLSCNWFSRQDFIWRCFLKPKKKI